MSDPFHALSPYDGRYEELGKTIAPLFSEAGLINFRVRIEITYLLALSKQGIIRPFSAKEKKFLQSLTPLTDRDMGRVKEIESGTRHDVTAAVEYVREKLKAASCADIVQYVHFGLTSEDINNLSWRLALIRAREENLQPALDALIRTMAVVANKNKSSVMLARTHGQPAVPTTFGKEIINVAVRLHHQREKLSAFRFRAKCSGAVGNLNAHRLTYPDTDWISFFDRFIESLGCIPEHFATQVNPNDDVVEYLEIIGRINSVLHGFSADMWRYISDGLIVQKSEGVGSSTMPQKINPIQFEHSEGVTEISNGLIGVLVQRLPESRLQRDLSDTPLFRFLGEIHATHIDALTRIGHAFGRLTFDAGKAHDGLWENFAILAEPLQLLLRKADIFDAYNLVKKHTQGKQFTQSEWKSVVDALIADVKLTDTHIVNALHTLSPDTYIGDAAMLVDCGIREISKYG